MNNRTDGKTGRRSSTWQIGQISIKTGKLFRNILRIDRGKRRPLTSRWLRRFGAISCWLNRRLPRRIFFRWRSGTSLFFSTKLIRSAAGYFTTLVSNFRIAWLPHCSIRSRTAIGRPLAFTLGIEFWLHLGRHEIHVGQWTRWVERRGLVSQSLVLQSFFTGEFHGHMLLAGSHAPKCSRLVGVKRRSVILIEGENLINHHFESPTHATYFWDWNLKV